MSVQRRRGAGTAQTAPPAAPAESESTHRVAYDPHEECVSDSKETPPLTLMEEILLLGLDDEEGQLSFWNDSISYVLRGCIMIELSLQGRIAMINDPVRRQHALSDRKVEVINARKTGDVLLDETLELMQKSEPMSVQQWVDCLSGETWNLGKLGYQLKQVRERLCKGLVDKKICRTSKKNYLFFDLATHPVVDYSAKLDVVKRLHHLIDSSTYTPDFAPSKWYPSQLVARTLRLVSLAASAQAANVLDNLYTNAPYDARDNAYLKLDELVLDFSDYPFVLRHQNPWVTSVFTAAEEDAKQLNATRVEVIAAVLQTYAQLDSVV